MLSLTAQALLVNFILLVPASMAGGEAEPSVDEGNHGGGARTIHVSPSGDDGNSGAQESPLRTVQNHIILKGNSIHDNLNQGILGNSHHVRIEGNVIFHNGYKPDNQKSNLEHGIYATGTDFEIIGNIIHSNRAYGIQVAGYPFKPDSHAGPEYATARRWLINHNTIAFEQDRAGIVIWQEGATGCAASSLPDSSRRTPVLLTITELPPFPPLPPDARSFGKERRLELIRSITDHKLSTYPRESSRPHRIGKYTSTGLFSSFQPTEEEVRRLAPHYDNVLMMEGRSDVAGYHDGGNKFDLVADSATVDGIVVGMSVKDYRPPKDVMVTPGTGQVNFPAVLARLKKGGFTTGPLIVETLKPGDLPALLEEAKKARRFLEEIASRKS